MKEYNKMVLTATTANSWIYPECKNWAENLDDLINDVVECYEAGATIAHVHLPRGKEVETVKRIREECDILIQAGMSSDSIPKRSGDFEAKPDMMSIILNHHDEHFAQLSVNKLHPLKELENYTYECKKYNIKPEWEVWHTGSYWNLNYLIEKNLVDKPHICTLFFNWPGGTWSPPTGDEYLHRIKYIPNGSVHTVSIMGPEQTKIAILAISNGGNVRVGTEDYPYIRGGVPAKNNAEIIARMKKISEELGREIATPSEGRKILGL
ncbi:MAG: 3-keto-5-aminohexanoate cleavage protein [Candidatus Lokiarchaeota archaeon]|nr:3-keto-5-aminohexanoate cleavage protein [Candidatus Lokiarchaeota archaeon]MBD3200252.1 3-keto-5-aminohexanoate cleavage protein [Candidatus Lokiarchaeota archaeon]